jgi:hypothetical protein
MTQNRRKTASQDGMTGPSAHLAGRPEALSTSHVMATQADVRRIALSLPNVEETKGRFADSVLSKGKQKGFVWVWMERMEPKTPRVPNDGVLAVRVANLGHKEAMISADSKKFFTEPHYNGFPAVLVRLSAVTVKDLEVLVTEAWRCQASPEKPKRGSRKR